MLKSLHVRYSECLYSRGGDPLFVYGRNVCARSVLPARVFRVVGAACVLVCMLYLHFHVYVCFCLYICVPAGNRENQSERKKLGVDLQLKKRLCIGDARRN